MKRLACIVTIAVLGLVLVACQQQAESEVAVQGAPETYLLTSNRLPADFADVVAANGDTLNALHVDAGFASITSSQPNAYNRFAHTIVRDLAFSRAVSDIEPVAIEMGDGHDHGEAQVESGMLETSGITEPPFTDDDDFFFDLQWGHDAVNAQAAWAQGHRGQGVRVAILDGGTDLDHPDLVPNTNFALSKDLTGQGLQYACDNPFSDAAHVGGIIAAADNELGTIGVAPEAELVFVKVLSEGPWAEYPNVCLTTGSFTNIIEGILYAADVGSDVITLSLSTLVPRGQSPGSEAIAAFRVAINQAITYANNAGATVIAAAGDDRVFLNVAGTINLSSLASHAMSVSAVGPIGWATDPGNIDLDVDPYYTNIGSEIDFAAPGGNSRYNVNPGTGGERCSIADTTTYCFSMDGVFSTGNVDSGTFGCDYLGGCWFWQVGTAQAAAYASGIAALIIGENGGDMRPAQVRRIMRERADDLAPAGFDFLYGHGRVASGY